MNYFLAVDIGASSGRHILGYIENSKIKLEEIHRFKNETYIENNHLCWDLNYLFKEIKKGLKKCKSLEKIPKCLGIDTWGVDFVLLDDEDKILGETASYRDTRTVGIMDKVKKELGEDLIYQKTGIQFMEFNTINQLKSIDKKIIKNAKSFLMIPDYFNYLLTGKKVNEYTNATTTQLYNVKENNWDQELLDYVGINKEIFKKAELPGTIVGSLQNSIISEIGFNCDVVLPATHDTGSAFVSSLLNVEENGVILSSGTWSLLGKEIKSPIVTKESMERNFTNEGGANNNYRFLKNIMGLWIIQEVIRNFEYKHTFSELENYARKSYDFKSIIDVNDQRFFAPEDMIKEIKNFCYETNQDVPKNIGEISICVYRSLAKSYKIYIDELSEIVDEEILKINIIGGGCQSKLLNELIVKETKKEVIAGPIEATAIGNLVLQMISKNELKDIESAKIIIKNSF